MRAESWKGNLIQSNEQGEMGMTIVGEFEWMHKVSKRTSVVLPTYWLVSDNLHILSKTW
jgi:hypothetical protein